MLYVKIKLDDVKKLYGTKGFELATSIVKGDPLSTVPPHPRIWPFANLKLE